ncbi:hypothetical protein [Candidatus Similichlamydia laticola]|uniref:Uncharacterized protein n=1 Tax=Candidatus Similichlamydia laticola TaxID=2170265 RepID=A0A369K9S1_9BACT|nr:hypothetical protein [Candidatus Similichlamydia laticola]RDB31341.1 hypothetical protein HAT2_00555 [Candidatus Similichlamydia laticola]
MDRLCACARRCPCLRILGRIVFRPINRQFLLLEVYIVNVLSYFLLSFRESTLYRKWTRLNSFPEKEKLVKQKRRSLLESVKLSSDQLQNVHSKVELKIKSVLWPTLGEISPSAAQSSGMWKEQWSYDKNFICWAKASLTTFSQTRGEELETICSCAHWFLTREDVESLRKIGQAYISAMLSLATSLREKLSGDVCSDRCICLEPDSVQKSIFQELESAKERYLQALSFFSKRNWVSIHSENELQQQDLIVQDACDQLQRSINQVETGRFSCTERIQKLWNLGSLFRKCISLVEGLCSTGSPIRFLGIYLVQLQELRSILNRCAWKIFSHFLTLLLPCLFCYKFFCSPLPIWALFFAFVFALFSEIENSSKLLENLNIKFRHDFPHSQFCSSDSIKRFDLIFQARVLFREAIMRASSRFHASDYLEFISCLSEKNLRQEYHIRCAPQSVASFLESRRKDLGQVCEHAKAFVNPDGIKAIKFLSDKVERLMKDLLSLLVKRIEDGQYISPSDAQRTSEQFAIRALLAAEGEYVALLATWSRSDLNLLDESAFFLQHPLQKEVENYHSSLEAAKTYQRAEKEAIGTKHLRPSWCRGFIRKVLSCIKRALYSIRLLLFSCFVCFSASMAPHLAANCLLLFALFSMLVLVLSSMIRTLNR